MRFRLLVFLGLLVFSGSAFAELKWERADQRFDRPPEDRSIEAKYAFRNVGTTPITIKTLRSSCGCTTAKLDQKTYGPGEGGEVLLKFSFGDRKGLYRKTVTVFTDENEATPKVLNLVVYIHDPLTITPGLVWWRKGEANEVKTVQLDAEAGQNIRITGVTSSSPRFSAKLVTTEAGSHYSIAIAPSDTAEKEAAEIKVQTNFPSDAPHAYTIFARIK